MDPLSATASIIAILQLSAKVLSYLSDVKGSSQGHAQCTIEASNLHNLLTNLRFRLEERHGHQPWFNAVQALAVKNGPLDQFKEALETLRAKITDHGRLKKVREALTWKFEKEEVDAILARMERLKTLVEIALQMDHFKLSQAIKDDTGSIRTHVSAIESAVNKAQQVQVTATQRILLEWISSSDYPAQQSDIIKRRQEGTGQWFLDAPEVARWLNDPKTTLFCPGIPGAGKTILAAITVDQLLDSAEKDAYGVAYVYCDYKSQADQNIVNILAAILKQLVQSRPLTLGAVEKLHQKHARRGTKPSLDDIYSALQDVLAQYPYVHIVVDALDECEKGTRRQLCTKLLGLQKVADVRLMVTSRFVPDVEDAFQLASKLEVTASDEDVKQFVIGQIHRLPGCVQRSPALQALVLQRVVETVGGMFLLARLHIDSLSDNTTAKEVRSTIATLSRGATALDDAYSEALERIEGQRAGYSRLAKSALTWITFAKRLLTTTELCCALAIEPGEAELDQENKPDVDDIVSVCAGLVVVDQESGIIRLVHYTTQEYFERIGSRLSPDGQLSIAEACLTYLSFNVFKSGSCATDQELEKRLYQHELLEYAARYCGEHIRSVEAKVAHLACRFLTHSGTLSCAAQVLFVPNYKFKEYSATSLAISGLHWIALFGLCDIAEQFLHTIEVDTVRAVNTRDSWGRCPLAYAAEYGHYELARLLLDKGADVDAQGRSWGNALQAASYRGHEAVVRLLLEKGADARYYGNVLEAASYRGYEAVVRVLLEKGADAQYYGNAFKAAFSEGHEAVVRLLLEKGVNINAQDDIYGNALQVASFHGHEAVVRLMLEKGADVHAQGGFYGNALQAASSVGSEAVVRLLLEKGVDVNAQGGYCSNALQAASSGGSEAVVRLLLEKGVNVDAQGGYYGNALLAASSRGHEAVVRLLLKKGVNVNAQGGFYGNALQAASYKGHEAVVRLLLEKGVNANAQGGFYGLYGNALHAAAYAGKDEVLKHLIEKTSMGQLLDPYGRTLVWWAAAGGQTATIQLLISRYNHDSRVADKFGRTPCWIATKKGHDAVLALLPEECRLTDPGPAPSPDHSDGSRSRRCDVCTSNIWATDFHYHCHLCHDGDWDVCEDCRMRGAFCAEETHILVKRTSRDGKLIEMTC